MVFFIDEARSWPPPRLLTNVNKKMFFFIEGFPNLQPPDWKHPYWMTLYLPDVFWDILYLFVYSCLSFHQTLKTLTVAMPSNETTHNHINGKWRHLLPDLSQEAAGEAEQVMEVEEEGGSQEPAPFVRCPRCRWPSDPITLRISGQSYW